MDSAMLQKGDLVGVLTLEMEFAMSLGNGVKISKRNPQIVKYGYTQGFLFRRKNGSPAKMGDFDEPLIERLVWIQENMQGFIPMHIDMWDFVGCRRSTRKGATTEAFNMEVDASWIDANKGWRKVERAESKMPSMSMRQLYTEMLQNLKHELNFSLAI
jgi:hypothetical protein